MKPSRHITLLAALIALALTLSGCNAAANGSALTPSEEDDGTIEVSGFLEAEEVSIVSERSGRVDDVNFDEADTVEAGDVVIVLDDTLLQSDRREAVAAVRSAEANLAEVKAGARAADVEAAQAAVERAEAQVEGATRASGQAWVTASDPKQIDVQIASARLELSQAQSNVDALNGQLAELERQINLVQMVPEGEEIDQSKLNYMQVAREELVAQLAAATATRDGAQNKLNLLLAERDRPVALIATAMQAQAQIPVAEAQVDLAEAQLDALHADARPEELAIAQAQVRLAEARVALVDAQIEQLTLNAPIGGTVTTRSIAPGETVTAGRPLMTIANLDALKLIVYIPEASLGQVQLNTPVRVTVDSYPGKTFEGRIANIARKAEFSPNNVQTEEERVNLVFAVEVEIPNDDGRLRPGMPAEVIIEPED